MKEKNETKRTSKFCGSIFVNLRFNLNCFFQGRARALHAPSFFCGGSGGPALPNEHLNIP